MPAIFSLSCGEPGPPETRVEPSPAPEELPAPPPEESATPVTLGRAEPIPVDPDRPGVARMLGDEIAEAVERVLPSVVVVRTEAVR